MRMPSTAIDNTPASRETALLMPDALPARSSGTEFITGAGAVSALQLSGTRQNVRTSTINARGILMKNAHRQEPCSIRKPPRRGPTAAVIDVKPDHVPI